MIGHPELYSRIPNKAVGGFTHWLQSFAKPSGLVSDFRLALRGHTLRPVSPSPTTVSGASRTAACASWEITFPYPKCRTLRPSVKEYSVFTQSAGVTDINESRFVSLN